VTPLFGPKSGGTKITIAGGNLDIGSYRTVLLGETRCLEESVNATHLICNTLPFAGSSTEQPEVQDIKLSIDRQMIYIRSNFTFKADPKIDDFFPKGATCSGKNPVSLTGKHLTSITNPSIFVFFNESAARSAPCRIHNDTYMTCLTPACPYDNFVPEHQKLSLRVEVYMDGNRVPDQPRQFALLYHPNPAYYHFDDLPQEVYLEDPIVEISGRDIAVDYYVNITVGSHNHPCHVMPQHERTKLWCRIQFDDVKPVVGDSVTVNYRIGETDIHGVLGSIIFAHKPNNGLSGVLLSTIIFLIFAFLVVLAALLYFKTKKNPKEKQRSFEVVFTNDRQGSANGKLAFIAFSLFSISEIHFHRLFSWIRKIRIRSSDSSHCTTISTTF
jgi:hypothetical protein